jgi:hypothetical protein
MKPGREHVALRKGIAFELQNLQAKQNSPDRLIKIPPPINETDVNAWI